MRKFLAVLAAAVLVFSAAACTNSNTGDTIGEYTPDENTYITEKGTFTFEEGAGDTAVLVKYVGKATKDDDVVIPDTFNGRDVAAIGNEAFYALAAVKSVKIPDTVVSIGDYAFADCTSLESIELPDSTVSIGDYAFNNCTALASVELGKSVKNIGDFAFKGCTALSEIPFPDSLESIGNGSFWACTALTEISTNKLTKIGTLAFYNCTALESIDLSNDLEEIGEFAFVSETTTFKDKIDTTSFSEGSVAAKYYADMADATTDENNGPSDTANPNDTTNPEGTLAPDDTTADTSEPTPPAPVEPTEYVYENDNVKLTFKKNGTDTLALVKYEAKTDSDVELEIPAEVEGFAVTAIGGEVFRKCEKLKSVVIPDSVTSIDYYAFQGCASLESVNLGNGVASIGAFAFADCGKLATVVFPDSLKTIGDGAFWHCYSITEIDTNEVTEIGDLAFYDCTGVQTVKLSDKLESIGDLAFITSESTLKDKIDTDSFSDGSVADQYYDTIVDL